MKYQRRTIVFETCGHPEALLMRVLRVLGWPVSAVNFVAGIEPGPVRSLPLSPAANSDSPRYLQELINDGFEAVRIASTPRTKDTSEFFALLSSIICGGTQLAEELQIAVQASLNVDAYPCAVIRALLGDETSQALLVTRRGERKRILKRCTQLNVTVLPFTDLPLRLAKSLRFGTHNTSDEPASETGARGKSYRCSDVLFFPHKGSTYGSLYPWEQYFSDDPASPCHPDNLLTLDYQINQGSLYKPGRFFWELVRLLPRLPKLLRALHSRVGHSHLKIFVYSIRLAIEVRILTHRLTSVAPSAKLALLSYDMLTPTNLSLALKVSGIKRIANLERGSVYLTGLPILVDTLAVPNEELEQRLGAYRMCSASVFVQVGHWRSDYIFRNSRPPINCDVLVLPYHVDGDCERNWGGMATSCRNFHQHIVTVLKLCREFPHLTFVLRTKNLGWRTTPGLETLVQEIETTPNLMVADDYSQGGYSYHFGRSAQLAIGRFSSIHEELHDYGIPVLVDNRGGSVELQFHQRDLILENVTICDTEEQFLRLAAAILNGQLDSPSRHQLCDGVVRDRIVRLIEDELRNLTN